MDIHDGGQKTYDAGKTTAIRIHREQRSFCPGLGLSPGQVRHDRLDLGRLPGCQVA
jgi:hypothetical protein